MLIIHDGGGAIYFGGEGFQGGGGAGDLLVGFGPETLLDCLADAGQSFDSVAGVVAGRVDHVLEPGTARQALGTGQDALGADEDGVELLGLFQRQLGGVEGGEGLGAGFEFRQGVVERGEIQEGHGGLGGGLDEGLAGIGREFHGSALEQGVALRRSSSRMSSASFFTSPAYGDGAREAIDSQWQHVGVGEAERQAAAQLHGGEHVQEVGIFELHDVIVGVVVGVVGAGAGALAAEADVEAGDAEVIDEGGVVGAGAERGDAELGCGGLAGDGLAGLGSLERGHFGLRIGDVAGGLAGEGFERVRAADVDEASGGAVGVDVDGGVLLELVGVEFGPFGGAEQCGLLAIPGAEDESAFRLPAGLGELGDGAGFFHQGDHAGERVRRAEDPGVVMIAADDPLVGALGAFHAGDDVVGGREIPVEFELEVDGRGAGSDVVGEGSAPRHSAPLKSRHDAGGVCT